MESKNEFDIKNCMCYHLDDIITDRDIDFSDILLDEKLCKQKYRNILIYDMS